MLTVLISDALKVEYGKRFFAMNDEVALIAVILRIHRRLLKDAAVPNPAAKVIFKTITILRPPPASPSKKHALHLSPTFPLD